MPSAELTHPPTQRRRHKTRPDFLAIGHIAKDLTPYGFTLGGAVTYAGVAAGRPELSVGVVTTLEVGPRRAGAPRRAVRAHHHLPQHLPRGPAWQVLTDVGGPIDVSDIPDGWSAAPLVLLGRLA